MWRIPANMLKDTKLSWRTKLVFLFLKTIWHIMIHVKAATQFLKQIKKKITIYSCHGIGHLISRVQTQCVFKTIKSCAKF